MTATQTVSFWFHDLATKPVKSSSATQICSVQNTKVQKIMQTSLQIFAFLQQSQRERYQAGTPAAVSTVTDRETTTRRRVRGNRNRSRRDASIVFS